MGSASSWRPATLRTSSRTSRSCCRSRRLQDGPARAMFAAFQHRLRDRARSRESSRSRRAAPGEKAEAALARARARLWWWPQPTPPGQPWAAIGPSSKTRVSSLVRLTSASGYLWLNGLTSDGREQPVGSHSAHPPAPVFPNVRVVHPARASVSPSSGDLGGPLSAPLSAQSALQRVPAKRVVRRTTECGAFCCHGCGAPGGQRRTL